MGLQIVQIDKEKSYDEWLAFRERGLGASEIGTLMGVNSWKSPAELYYQKIGVIPQKQVQNMPMFMGTILEKTVAEIFEYWDVDEATMIRNYDQGTKVRNLYEPVGYLINDKYPHLFFSPDRLIIKSSNLRVRDGVLNLSNVEAVVEIKTISGWSSKQWSGGIPPSYYLQLQTYLMGLDIQKGYLVALEDGRNIKVHEFERDQEMIDSIANVTRDFWERVELGREFLKNGEDYEQFSPEPDGTEAYAEFLNEKYKNPEEKSIVSTEDIDLHLIDLQSVSEKIVELEEQKRLHQNFIKDYMGYYTMLDSKVGKVTWRPNKSGSRVFRVS
jgi:putative phage-type endonuclease